MARREDYGWDDKHEIIKMKPPVELLQRFGFDGLKLPRDYLSTSSVEKYLRCPRQYYWSYVENLKTPPNPALLEGSSHHEVFEFINQRRIDDNNFKISTKQLLEIFVARFEEEEKDVEDWQEETKDDIIERAKQFQTLYVTTFLPRFVPALSEYKVQLECGKLKILGFCDAVGLLDGQQKVVDYKVVKRTKTIDQLNSSLQVGFYTLMSTRLLKLKLKEVGSGYCMLVKTNKPKIAWLETQLTKNSVEWFRNVVWSVAMSVSRGSFPPCDPTEWVCTEKFCDFWNICRGKK